MNYFGHAAVALDHQDSPLFVLGAMLPDLAGMLRSRCPASENEPLRRGLAFHQTTDAVFHQCATFVALNLAGTQALRDAGVARGPARAAAHLVTELLLDAVLATQARYARGYLEALAVGRAGRAALCWPGADHDEEFRALAHHLHERGPALHDANPERLTQRVARTLHGRPRLEPSPAELARIGVWARGHADAVQGGAETLLRELRAGLLEVTTVLETHS